METLNVIQGSDEWVEMRGKYCNASEAPIILGEFPNVSRDDLLKYKTTGSKQEISYFTQLIFDEGHETEALARPIAESRLGEELYPVTGVREVDGLRFLSSFDGLSMMEDEIWEHKQFNKQLYELVKSGGPLMPKHYWQLEHQMLVADLNYCTFAVSDGTEENYADIRYESIPERREKLILSWKQFVADKDGYQPIFIEPKAIAEIVEPLPNFNYETKVTGTEIELVSNLVAYKSAALKLVEQSKLVMETDQDFANAESRIRMCKDAEENIERWRSQLMGKFVSVDKCDKELAQIFELLRQCRLNETKQVTTRKDKIRFDIIEGAKASFANYIKAANEAIAALDHGFRAIIMPTIPVDFAGAIKGKKTIKSLQESANNELARAKVEGSRILNIIDQNLALMKVTAKDYAFLFSDIASLIGKDSEDLKAIAINRIAEHKQKEQAAKDAEALRIANEAVEAERKRVADEYAEIERKRVADEAKKKPNSSIQITSVGKTVEQEIKLEPQSNLFSENLIGDGRSTAPFTSAADEYFGDPVSSPVVDDSTGKQTVIGSDEIIFAVSAHWGITLAQAELACLAAFEPKL